MIYKKIIFVEASYMQADYFETKHRDQFIIAIVYTSI